MRGLVVRIRRLERGGGHLLPSRVENKNAWRYRPIYTLSDIFIIRDLIKPTDKFGLSLFT